MNRFTYTALAALSLSLSACVTTETNPSEVSMWDLTSGKQRLDDYLQTRRDELASLKDSTSSLEQRLAVQEAQLQKVTAKSKAANPTPTASDDKLYKEVSAKQVELDQAKAKLGKISQNIQRYDERLSSGKVENKNEAILRVAEYQTDLEYQSGVVEKLERDISKLNARF